MDCEPAGQPEMRRPASPYSFDLSWIFFASFAMVLAGMILMAFASFTQGQAMSGGAVILIGPIPIILGSGPESTWLIMLGAVFMIAALVFFLLSLGMGIGRECGTGGGVL
jgi:uncharacterized membrane protein